MAVTYISTLVVLMLVGFGLGRMRAQSLTQGGIRLHSLPDYHGAMVAIGILVPMLVVFAIGAPLTGKLAQSNALGFFPASVSQDGLQAGVALRDTLNLAAGKHSGAASAELVAAAESYKRTLSIGGWSMLLAGIIGGLAGFAFTYRQIGTEFRARNVVERVVGVVLIAAATVAILTTLGIVLSVLFESYRFFFDPAITGKPTITQFLFGLEWNPQAAMRADQGEIATAYGFIPLLVGSLLITFIAILVAGPLGLFCAIYLAEYASPSIRATAKPVLEILAGIPTVVLGFFAALTVAPLVRDLGSAAGLDVASESALAAGLVMGMMIIPFISSLSDDVINAVPQSLRDGAYAMGATKSETIRQVVLPAALPGIVSAFMLAISRAIGETMIVVMAAGLAANLTFNPFDAVTTITVQIKTILVGDQEFDSAKTLAAFALGLSLFFVTLMLNFVALRVVQKYREQYD
ncbi:MAG: phosphate ABC transporter permease subunit PstC [Hyphomicrobiaceae bacterium]|nr:phosphate ABC transporter permease subunit PstC [Hyphomicrobiaceae bacterium]